MMRPTTKNPRHKRWNEKFKYRRKCPKRIGKGRNRWRSKNSFDKERINFSIDSRNELQGKPRRSSITKCGRCGKKIYLVDAESCWYCINDLCFWCWNLYGHCGHEEAEKMNKEAKYRNNNCLSYWYPKIKNKVPTPNTIIIKTNCELIKLIDGKMPDGYGELLKYTIKACKSVGYPCFLRTGLTSGKHWWEDTCYIQEKNDIHAHITTLVEFSLSADILGLPHNVWVVRELLPTSPLMHVYRNMPVVKEFRFFVEDEKIKCFHPYWPHEALMIGLKVPDTNFDKKYNLLCQLSRKEYEDIANLASISGAAIGGSWSVDIMKSKSGWYVIDMAEAKSSWHWPKCKMDPRNEENNVDTTQAL
jgi:hypothetical protein